MWIVTVVVSSLALGLGRAQAGTEAEGVQFLEEYNAKAGMVLNKNVKASWNYYTNITEENLDIMTASNLEYAAFSKEVARNITTRFSNWNTYTNASVKRQFKKLVDIGFAAINDTEKLKSISTLEAELTGIYSTGKACLPEFGKGCLSLEPGLTDLMAGSRNYQELLAAWKGWRDASGKKMKSKYTQFVNVMNEAIAFSGYNDTGEYWRSWYETPSFEEDVKNLYEQLRPLYEQLHAYVRRKLMNKYGKQYFPDNGHIPAHLFGNMWSQDWGNIYDLVEPYPDATSVDITAKMLEKGYNITHMYRVAEEFFTSIGLDPMPAGFWTKSMLEKPADREVVCHASAWDFYDGQDFRIKQCTLLTQSQLLTVHHEMGHVIYFLAFVNQPVIFRDGANTGFHEGMADIVSLSFQTPEHMKAIGLLDEIPTDNKSDLNFLLKMALDKVAFLPFGYLIDQWRWSVFKGATTPGTYNHDWWDLRCQYQGISPPIERSEDDFDPGAKYHIPGNTPYIRYFVSYILQFQWHKALCDEIGYVGPLHRCDVYRDVSAGNLLREMLKLGSSKPWQDAMEVITGSREMSVLPMVEYFDPLLQWLKEQNKEENIGWSSSCPTNIPSPYPPSPTSASSNINPSTLLASMVLLALTLFV
ncbi:angiotensin-converting enzyme-like isoform X1 [Mizuhopecten yessoensis]|uniref:angiotensin-converting enzyme-like isoform X1 n=1 Tax=Mizuhopecten yessoensis TaxID=6573 RepID=UPI000B459B89|nr:angiotensin-converting enzyme-like isoform X1 [Mizuhopecten yessoensis]